VASSAYDSWTTQQLVEFLASVSSYADAPSAILGAVETAAAALEAEVAAVVVGDRVEAAIGYPRGKIPETELVAAAKQPLGRLRVEGLGECRTASVPVEGDHLGWLMVARHWGEDLSDAEKDLLRGMGRVLAMALESVRLLDSVRERQALLERLSRLQRSIAGRVDLQNVLDSIVAGAAELLGDEVAALQMIAGDDETRLDLVSSVGIDEDVLATVRRASIGQGASGRAISEGRLVTLEDYADTPKANPELASDGLQAAMAAPVFQRGEIAGSLVVGTRNRGRAYSDGERDVLTAFAEHAGLALNDAQAVAETVHHAFHDSLTDLPNRALFLDRLENATAGSDRGANSIAVLFIDLDGFKTVNDSLGHEAGDELLVMVAERLCGELRPDDTAARFGGDEFAILLEEVADRATARNVAQRILESFEQPFELRGREVSVTASIGISDGTHPPDHLLRNADLAMYQAKNRGKGRYEIFEPGMHAAVVERLELEADLRQALSREEFLLHYQPVCRLETGEVVGVEALARWEHPARGLIEPKDFIPLAEESRQILALGRWVLREACRQAAVWQARHRGALEMSVNLSGIQLEQPDLVAEVRSALERADLDPASLTLEITETALMSDSEANIEKLQALKALGVRLAVDDFGTGYSSLEYLRRFPIDILKVAKSFVDDLQGPAEGAPLVQAILDLADSFGLSVVAEGIEHAAQRDRLVELGCEFGQGFYFAVPANAATADSTLLNAAVLGTTQPHPDTAPKEDY
jgi:diguanylate cyclase (GGDEF)-like protein